MLTLAQLANHLGGDCHGNPDSHLYSVASLTQAAKHQLSYIDNPSRLVQLKQTKAEAVLCSAAYLAYCPVNAIVVKDPKNAFIQAIQYFKQQSSAPCPKGEIHKTACIHPEARLGLEVSIGPNTYIGKNVSIGDGVSIAANVVLGEGVEIGDASDISHAVCIYQSCQLGREVRLEPGVVLGASPFNYAKQQGRWIRGFDLGTVVIEDQVTIGSNTVICRGTLEDTLIRKGVCIDNLVHIAHDVVIGEHSALAAAAIIGACAEIGSHCIIGGGSCLAPNIRLCDDVVVTGMSTVSKSINKAGLYSSGTTVSDHKRWRKNASRFRHLDEYIRRLNSLEKLKRESSND